MQKLSAVNSMSQMWKKFLNWLLKHFKKRNAKRKHWKKLKKMTQKSSDIQMYFLTFKLTAQALKSNIMSTMICHIFLNELKSELITEWY